MEMRNESNSSVLHVFVFVAKKKTHESKGMSERTEGSATCNA